MAKSRSVIEADQRPGSQADTLPSWAGTGSERRRPATFGRVEWE